MVQPNTKRHMVIAVLKISNDEKYQVFIQVFLKPKNKLVDSGTCIKSPIVTNELQAPPPYDSFLYLK